MVGSSVVTIAFGDEFILPALHSDIDSDFSSIFFLYNLVSMDMWELQYNLFLKIFQQ